jgi:hypothetical protein
MIYETSDVSAGRRADGARVDRADDRTYTFCIVPDGSGDRALPLTVFLPDGGEAIALFSGEEEARMFCHLGRKGAGSQHVREIPAGEVLSLLHRAGASIEHVALDPFPEVLGTNLLELLALPGERFARRFVRPVSEQAAE